MIVQALEFLPHHTIATLITNALQMELPMSINAQQDYISIMFPRFVTGLPMWFVDRMWRKTHTIYVAKSLTAFMQTLEIAAKW